ncbi:MAG: kelch repeat-containing protein [Saprospiraceae bacterium]
MKSSFWLTASLTLLMTGLTLTLSLAQGNWDTSRLLEGDNWEEVAQLPFEQFLMSAEKVDTMIYLFGGIELSSTGATSTTGVYVFNPADNSLQARKPLPKPLAAMASAAYGGNIYLFGGMPWSQGPPSRKCYKYIPSLDDWFELPDLPTMPRSYAIAEVLGDKIYVIGGIAENSVTTYNLVEVFDPVAGEWSAEPVAPMPTPRGYMGSAVLNNRIYVFGGGTPAPDYYGLPTVEYFDGVSWTTVDTMPTHRYGAGAGVIGDSIIYVSGGVLSGWSDVNVTEGYSETTGWHSFNPLPVNMHGHAVVSFGDVLYAFGGVAGPTIYNTVLVYHPPFVVAAHERQANRPGLLHQNFPNPFADGTTIQYEVTSPGDIEISLQDMTGKVVKTAVNRHQFPGTYSVNLPADDLCSGVYFYTMRTVEGVTITKKMVVLK